MFKRIIRLLRRLHKRGCKDLTWRLVLLSKSNIRQLFLNEYGLLDDIIKNGNFYIDDLAEIKNLISEVGKERVIKEANKILNHCITLFHSKEIKFGPKIAWTADPITRKQWPKKNWTRINIRNAELGDVRVIWELNRHKHFVTLGKAYQYTQNKKYYDEFVAQLTDWLQENPYENGINWTSPLEAAMRAISWLWAYCLFKSAPTFKEVEKLILKTIYEHGEYIYRYRSEYLCPNNHLIGEASALYLISASLPFLDNGLKWRNKAKKILEREIEREVYSDGCDKEQTFSYHRFVIDLLLQVLIISKKIGDNFSDKFVKKLEKMIEFMMYVLKFDCKLPMIGDSDTSRGMPVFDNDDFWVEKDIFCIGSILFKRGDFKYFAHDFSEGTAWLLGKEGYRQFCTIRKKKPSFLSKKFEESGYYIMRNSWDDGMYLIFDAGLQGIWKISAHGHADHLSFELSAFNKDIIIDPGTYTYFFADRYRDHFRSTAAHNTVVIDNKPQSEPISNFDWGKINRSKIVRWNSNNEYDLFEAYHKCYSPIIHKRKAIFLKNKESVIIKDFIYGEKKHKIDINFHLSPGLRLIEKFNSTIIAQSGDLFLLIYQCDEKMRLNILNDFVSYNYGQLMSSITVNYTKTEELPVEFMTIILLYKNKYPKLSDDAVEKFVKEIDNL